MDKKTRLLEYSHCHIYVFHEDVSDQLTAILDEIEHYTMIEDSIEVNSKYYRHVHIMVEQEYSDELMVIVGALLAYCDEKNKGITDIHKRKHPIISLGNR